MAEVLSNNEIEDTNIEIDYASDLIIASMSMKFLCTCTSYLKGIKMSPNQLFNQLNAYNESAFSKTLTLERVIYVVEHLCHGIIVKYTTNEGEIMGYAFYDEHLDYLVASSET